MNEFNTFSSSTSDFSSLSSNVGDIGNTVTEIAAIALIASILATIVIIVILVKSIIDRKRLKAELTFKTINGITVTAVILMAVNALSAITNWLSVLVLAMPIISVVFTSTAKKELENNPDLAKSKANTASILNIICAALPALLVVGAVILGVIVGLMYRGVM